MEIRDFVAAMPENLAIQGDFESSAPSNIALVKYWGKLDHQIPANPSLSFTLSNCKTITKLGFRPIQPQNDFSFDFRFEGQPKQTFRPKIQQFLERIFIYQPFLKHFHFFIDTENTFPHSSGIASSASGMAALAVNLMRLERELNPKMTEDYFYKKASFLARLGSGSACRSIKGEIVVWGETKSIPKSSDLYGISFEEKVHDIFKNYQDTILLVDKGEKQVSSTVGHDLMNDHPFAAARFDQAHKNLASLKEILKSGNLPQFIALVESEALTLHAMMMSSNPYFILMKPNTLEIINAIWKYRIETKTPICFTLDAGANVHLLYPESVKDEVLEFIKKNLVGYCQNEHYICDEVGSGSVLLS